MTVSPTLVSNPETLEEEILFPPGDLYSDEPPVESELHLRQIILLIQCLERLWRSRQDFYAAGNLTIYYSPRQVKSEDFRGPDFFVVLGTERKPRKSWTVWEENGKYPDVIVEILSKNTASVDRGLKKQIYENTFRTAEYFWFDPDTLEFEGFVMVGGQYQAIAPNPSGYLWSQELGLYLGICDRKLRFFNVDGELILTPDEVADREAQRADTEAQRAARLAAKLRELNIDPDTL
ncbi:Uma2 family endonuclease [Roseofilum sp. BLCC_M154]|uniref:Uma2 family endonuclease n=1 Tax=Roseofilum acuticapitatum BLCC-M154 TaxID=3022444 RepID=A0ABT7AYL3_9CYAN|nr:Uma2 family endonuclease [Roseofilum acuticapitatum]MDJ1171993.1 Uma2 family endonuclease [Roseofilum acuticapitatum BLCC-M154]